MEKDQDLLNDILSKTKLHEKENLACKVYRDEPILMTASRMANYTPPVYKKMRDIARNACCEPENVLFYKQAMFMEHHVDNYEHSVEFQRYFPTYMSMSDAQLRCYFTWRTKIRNGEFQKTSLSFAYIYIYELLNGIGATTAEDGFLKLLLFFQQYRQQDYYVEIYMNRWLKDYCIYYNLDAAYVQMIPGIDDKSHLFVLMNAENHTDEDIFCALQKISSYNMHTSRFFKKHSDVCIAVTADVVKELNDFYKCNSLQDEREYFFGSFTKGMRMLFSGAVFYDRLPHDNYHYTVSDVEDYYCVNGRWQFHQFMLYNGHLQRSGELMRTIDSLLRMKYDFKHSLKSGSLPDKWYEIIQQCIDNYVLRKEYENAPTIEIDLNLLNSIRRNATVTQDRLLIYNEDVVTEPVIDLSCKAEHQVLSSLQVQFLRCLLNKESYSALIKEHNTTAILLSDEINELLFDEIDDTVIIFEDDEPVILEDYADFLKGYLNL